MESSTCDTGGFLVDKRKRKSTSPEADGDRLKENVEFDKSGMEQHGGAPTCYVQIGSTMVQETQKEDKDDKLLVLRDVLQESMEEEVDKAKQNNNDEESNEVHQLIAPLYTQSGLAMKEKYAKLRKRQKGRLHLRNAGKGPRQVGPEQRSDPEIFKKEGANASSSSLMSLKGKDITVPSAALPNKVTENVSDSGLQSSTRESLLRKRPAGFLKRNTRPNDWSELELDALWVGVRRYGQSNWEKILKDPIGFIFSKNNRTPQDLSTRWNIELLKIFPFPQQPTT